MGLTTTYLVKTSGLNEFLEAIKNAQAPEKFSHKFLQDLGFKSTNDRLFIGVLKALGLLDEASLPTTRYYNFLDPGQSDQMLREGIMEAYEDLFSVNKKAFEMTINEVKGKLKSLTQGSKSESVYANMARTFKALSDLVEWKLTSAPQADTGKAKPIIRENKETATNPNTKQEAETIIKRNRTELHYNIQIHLPATRDNAVYDAIFQSLKKHLIDD